MKQLFLSADFFILPLKQQLRWLEDSYSWIGCANVASRNFLGISVRIPKRGQDKNELCDLHGKVPKDAGVTAVGLGCYLHPPTSST